MKLKYHAMTAGLLGLLCGSAVAGTIFLAARSTSNNGEFFDAVSGAPVWGSLVPLLTVWLVAAAVIVALVYSAVLGLLRRLRGS